MARVPAGLRKRAEGRQKAQRKDVRKLARQAAGKQEDGRRIARWMAGELRTLARKSYRGWLRALASSLKLSAAGIKEPTDAEIAKVVDAPLAGESWRDRLTRGKAKSPAALARTEGNRIDHAMRELAQRRLVAGTPKKVTAFRYVTAKDERVCRICAPDDGKLFRVGRKRPRLPRHAVCRCYYLPVVGRR